MRNTSEQFWREIHLSRRSLLKAGILSSAALPFTRATSQQANSLTLTPTQPAGPNYPDKWQAQPLGDLRVGRMSEKAVPFALVGIVRDRNGRAQPGVRVELWQCDALGMYHHDYHSKPHERDSGFTGFGWQRADEGGRFAFMTVKITPCENRTPHFHVAVVQTGKKALITQLYLPGFPGQHRDIIYRGLTEVERRMVTLRLDRENNIDRGFAELVVA
jgi:protocatechuate 3,4-dioxygenase, beta subunit